MTTSRPAVLLRLADPDVRAVAEAALAAKYAVTVEDADGAPDPARWREAGYDAVVLDYQSEDAASVKLLQTVTDAEGAPGVLFVLPRGFLPEPPEGLMAVNEGARALLPTPLDGTQLANYVGRALRGPGRFRRERADDGGAGADEGEARLLRPQLAARDRLLGRLLSTAPSTWARRVLLVGDSAFQREKLQRLLEEYGFEVTTASSASEAVERALADKPRIVVSDYELGDTDGVALCRTLKLERKYQPCHFIVCTANETKIAEILSPGNGVDDCLPKPSGPSENADFIARAAMGILL